MWISAFSTRLPASRCRSSATPVDRDRARAGRARAGGPEESARGLLGGLARDRGEVERRAAAPRARRRRARAAAGRRPGGACAARSAAPTRPSRAARRASSASSSSRLARMLVSGVRSSCEASATKSRWRSSVASVSSRAAPSSRSMSSSVLARSDTSSLARGLGSVMSGSRVRATSRAARVRPGDRAHRARATYEAAEEGEQRAAEHAEGEEQADAVDRVVDGRLRLRVLDVGDRLRRPGSAASGPKTSPRADRARDHERARDDAVVAQVGQPLGARLGQVSRARRAGRPRGRRTQHAHLRRRRRRRRSAAPSEIVTSAVVEPRARRRSSARSAARGAQVVVEARPDALLGHRADHDGEHAQDPERQRGRDDGQLEADRAGGSSRRPSARSPRRAPCAARAARRRPRACGAGWR